MRKHFFSAFLKTIATLCIVTAIGCFAMALYSGNVDNDYVNKAVDIADRAIGKLTGNTAISGSGNTSVAEPVSVESVSYDRYAYQQLDSTTQGVYDQIYDCIINFKDKVSLTSYDENVLATAYEAMMADYGSLFWMRDYKYNTYKRGDSVVGLEFEPKYTMTQAERDDYQARIDEVAAEWLSGISSDASDYDKALYVFETLIDNVDYDTESEQNQNIISVFINKSTVCQGYADAAWYLLDKLGIKSTIVTGNANNQAHAWNLVYLDGAYYYMDVTWGNSRYLNLDNSTTKRVNYAYLAMTTQELTRTHTLGMSIEMPECVSTADNYFVKNGLYFNSFDANAIGSVLGDSYNRGDESISIKLADAALYSQVSQYFFDDQHISQYCRGLSTIYYLMDESVYVISVQW